MRRSTRVLVLVVASLAAYALARLDFPGKKLLTALILATIIVPPISLLIPNVNIVSQLGWLDSLVAIIVPGAAGALGGFFLRRFVLSLPVATSDDLVEWSASEDALPERPDWQPVRQGLTWAPEVVEVDGHWLMYYVARENASGLQCLAPATADEPAGPFEDTSSGPLVCQRELGGAIDAFAFEDTDGARYLFWKNDGNALGLDTSIWVQRLSADGTRLEGAPVDTGLRQTRPWQGALVEAPTVVLRDGTYVLLYSANDDGSDACAMATATATAVTGPYVDRSEQPWVDSEGDAAGPGGQAVIERRRDRTGLAPGPS